MKMDVFLYNRMKYCSFHKLKYTLFFTVVFLAIDPYIYFHF